MTATALKRASEFLAPIAAIYGYGLDKHGAVPLGVFCRTEEDQRIRFEALLGIVDAGVSGATFNDLGCGYGAFFEHIRDRGQISGGRYVGYDISEAMIETAQRRNGDPRTAFHQAMVATEDADYSIASGTFNMSVGTDDGEWTEYVEASLDTLWQRSRRGMAFNMLSLHADERQNDLHYADPAHYLDYCLRRLSPRVALLHDYGLAEWTMLVRR